VTDDDVIDQADLDRLLALKRSLQRRIEEQYTTMLERKAELRGIEAAIRVLQRK